MRLEDYITNNPIKKDCEKEFTWSLMTKQKDIKPGSKLRRLHFVGNPDKRYIDDYGAVFKLIHKEFVFHCYANAFHHRVNPKMFGKNFESL